MADITIEKRRALVMDSIERVRVADAKYREIEADAGSSPELRRWARDWRQAAELEFGWQWRNVEVILKGGE